MIKMRRSDAVAVELFDVELLNAVKQYGITTADRRAVKLAGTADKRRGARYHDLIGIGKLGTGNIALDDRNTVFAAETDKMAACDTGEDKMSERRGDKLTVLENRDVGMCALGHDVAILGTVLLEQAASYLNSLVAARTVMQALFRARSRATARIRFSSPR